MDILNVRPWRLVERESYRTVKHWSKSNKMKCVLSPFGTELVCCHIYSAQQLKRNTRIAWQPTHFVLLQGTGWSRRDQTESHCFKQYLAFIQYHNKWARCPQPKATTQKAQTAVGPNYHVSFAEHFKLHVTWQVLQIVHKHTEINVEKQKGGSTAHHTCIERRI